MSATGKPKGSSKRAWQILLCLTLLALLFRAVFPAGYMPRPSGPGNGILTLALCAPHEGITLMPAGLGDDPPEPDHDGAAQACPFCTVVSQAIMPGAAMLELAAEIAPAATLTLPDGVKPLPALIAGPPLGPRAPPALLG